MGTAHTDTVSHHVFQLPWPAQQHDCLIGSVISVAIILILIMSIISLSAPWRQIGEAGASRFLFPLMCLMAV